MRLALLSFALTCSACGPAAYAGSTFEGDDENWTLSNNAALTNPTLMREGGNPQGHLCGRDEGDGDIWYFVAPLKFLGNASSAYGKRLTFDLKQGSIFNQVRGRDVVLNGGGLAITWNIRFPPNLDWTPYSVRLDGTSGWHIDEPSGNGPDATEDDLKTVLSDVRSVRIRGEFFDGLDDTACIDNVYFGRD
ncbi:MAG TPA: laminin B domain-containing protein [Archangium sp.]